MHYQLEERAPSVFWAAQEENEGSTRIREWSEKFSA
jgi:hypothetical protein